MTKIEFLREYDFQKIYITFREAFADYVMDVSQVTEEKFINQLVLAILQNWKSFCLHPSLIDQHLENNHNPTQYNSY